MSDTKQDKVFCDGLWFKEKVFDDGGSILKVSILTSKFAEFLKTHKKEDGFVNIVISKRRQPSEKGETHYATLDTFVPNTQASKPTGVVKSPKVAKQIVTKPVDTSAPEETNDF